MKMVNTRGQLCPTYISNQIIHTLLFHDIITLSVKSHLPSNTCAETWTWFTMSLLPDMQNCGLRMHRECRERLPSPRVSDTDMHHGTCVTHVPWCIPGSLTSGFLWSRWRGKRSWHSRRRSNLRIYVSGKRPMELARIGTARFYRVSKTHLA